MVLTNLFFLSQVYYFYRKFPLISLHLISHTSEKLHFFQMPYLFETTQNTYKTLTNALIFNNNSYN